MAPVGGGRCHYTRSAAGKRTRRGMGDSPGGRASGRGSRCYGRGRAAPGRRASAALNPVALRGQGRSLSGGRNLFSSNCGVSEGEDDAWAIAPSSTPARAPWANAERDRGPNFDRGFRLCLPRCHPLNARSGPNRPGILQVFLSLDYFSGSVMRSIAPPGRVTRRNLSGEPTGPGKSDGPQSDVPVPVLSVPGGVAPQRAAGKLVDPASCPCTRGGAGRHNRRRPGG